MCLNNVGERKIATEDIVCYKRLKVTKRLNPDVPHRSAFTGIINTKSCKGKISWEEDRAYFCTNNSHMDGERCKNRLRYRYSWRVDDAVASIIVDGKEQLLSAYITPYKNADVEIGKEYTSDLIRIVASHEVHIGIHSFERLIDAHFDSSDIDRDAFAECIIPKGSEYYKGVFNSSVSYASNKIKYVELCV